MPKRKHRKAAPWVPPPGSPPLADVVKDLFAKSKQLNEMDDKISMSIATIERQLIARRFERIVSVKLPDGADLGWSYDRRARRWRFVIRMDDEVWELRSVSREERAEVFSCGAMQKLLEQAGAIHGH